MDNNVHTLFTEKSNHSEFFRNVLGILSDPWHVTTDQLCHYGSNKDIKDVTDHLTDTKYDL